MAVLTQKVIHPLSRWYAASSALKSHPLNLSGHHLQAQILFHTSRYLGESYYETLQIQPDCTEKEIRNAFISLSKKHHPDTKTASKDSHTKFVRINEAYSVLGKPEKRKEYDFLLSQEAVHNRNIYTVHHTKSDEWRDETIWHMRDRSKDGHFREQPYYGIKGLKRLSNTWIVIACIIFTSIGVGLQFLAIRRSITLKREAMLLRSEVISKEHSDLKQKAIENGKERQIELLRQRLTLSSSSSSIP